MKPADRDLHSGRAQAASDIHGARKLVGLHSHQGHHAAAAAAGDLPRNALGADARIGLIESRNVDGDVIAQYAAFVAVQGEAIQHRQSIGGDAGAEPLDDVSLVVVVRWLDQDQGKALGGHGIKRGRRARGSRPGAASLSMIPRGLRSWLGRL